jgi:hypothetical protein
MSDSTEPTAEVKTLADQYRSKKKRTSSGEAGELTTLAQ